MSGSWVTDGSGTRWVEYAEKKRRKPARALRFADLKVGDQLMQVYVQKGWRGGVDDTSKPPIELSRSTNYYVVTDLWFDPVAGERHEVAGRMAALARIRADGEVIPGKRRHTLRGLASQGYVYADRDYIAWCKERLDAMRGGQVVGIGRAHAIRQRPKLPGSRL